MNTFLATGVTLLATASLCSAQTTWHVDAAGTAPGTGTPLDPFTRIDYALAQPGVVSGDTVLVQPGDYPDEVIDFLGKDVVLESAMGSQVTRIVGPGGVGQSPGPFLTLENGETSNAHIRGFSFVDFRNQFGSTVPAVVLTGSAPRWEDCTFQGAIVSGALLVMESGANPTFLACEWRDNTTSLATLASDASDLLFESCGWYGSDRPLFQEGGNSQFVDCLLVGNRSASELTSYFSRSAVLVANGTAHLLRTTVVGSTLTPSIADQQFDLRASTITMDQCVVSRGETVFTEGGALFADGCDLHLQDCTFSDWESDRGGALAVQASTMLIERCAFFQNTALTEEWEGGALMARTGGTVTIRDSQFIGNGAGYGGALASNDTPLVIQNCRFQNNTARRETYLDMERARGGAIWSLEEATIEDCEFTSNHASASFGLPAFDEAFGGALFLGANSVVQRCDFRGNTVAADEVSEGGAVYMSFPGELTQCVFFENEAKLASGARGGALGGTGLADRCTLVSNRSTGPSWEADDWTLTQCLVVPLGPTPFGAMAQVQYSLVDGGYAGVGNFDGEPRFWGAEDFHLMPGSFAIDASPLGVDPDGSPADVGAYPYEPDYCGPDCTTDVGWLSCVTTLNSTGEMAEAFVLGSTKVSDNDLVVAAHQVPVQTFGYFLMSPEPDFVPFFGGSRGHLCLGFPVLRWNDQIEVSNLAGQMGRRLDLGNLPQGYSVLAGDRWYFQLWFRDFVQGASTSNTSSALRVDFH